MTRDKAGVGDAGPIPLPVVSPGRPFTEESRDESAEVHHPRAVDMYGQRRQAVSGHGTGRHHEVAHFEGGDSPATHTSSQYNTTDGRFLIRLGKGKYRIEETDIILQANDPNAT